MHEIAWAFMRRTGSLCSANLAVLPDHSVKSRISTYCEDLVVHLESCVLLCRGFVMTSKVCAACQLAALL